MCWKKSRRRCSSNPARPARTIKVGEDKGGPTLDTAESGGHAVAVGAAALDAGPISRGYTEELEHWAWCIKNPAPEHKPRCGPEVALADAVIALVTTTAIRDPKDKARIEFKDEWFDLTKRRNARGRKAEPESRRIQAVVIGQELDIGVRKGRTALLSRPQGVAEPSWSCLALSRLGRLRRAVPQGTETGAHTSSTPCRVGAIPCRRCSP